MAKNKNNVMCWIFGHKYIFHIQESIAWCFVTRVTKLEEPVCKRCGEKLYKQELTERIESIKNER